MQYLILHGSFGNSQENWFPWLKQQLENQGHSVVVPNFPTDDWDELEKHGAKANKNQTLPNWLATFKTQVIPNIDPSKPISLAAHSLGPLFTLHALKTFDLKVDTAVYVAPFLNRLPNIAKPIDIGARTFYLDTANKPENQIDGSLPINLDFNKLKNQIKTAYALYSDNDPYVPTQQSLDFAQAINAKPIQIKSGGHLNATAGYNEFPKLGKLLT